MRLKKTSESVSRQYDGDGNSTEFLENAQYQIISDEGDPVGNCTVRDYNADCNFCIGGFSTIAEGEAKIKQMLGIED